MPRRREVPKREILPDPKYHEPLVTQFVNSMMRDGKKSTAESIMYDTLEAIEQRTGEEPVKLFVRAIDNMRPAVEVRSRRVGGSTYQVPVEVRPSRRQALAMRWLVDSARKRGEKSMAARLAGEALDERRSDRIAEVHSIDELEAWLKATLAG